MTRQHAFWGAVTALVVVVFAGCSKGTETRTCNAGTVLVHFVCAEPLGKVTASAALEGLAGQTTTKDVELACPGSLNLEVSVTGYEAGGKIKAVVSANAGDMILATNKLVEIQLEPGCTKYDLTLSSSGVLTDNPDAPVATNGGTGGANNGGAGGINSMTDIDAAPPAPDADPTSVGVARGGTCVRDDQCTDGHCADGVCCDKACDGLCLACTKDKTGVTTGQCAFAITGVKDSQCEAKAASTCGTNGMCNGAGQCSFWDAANECVAAVCNGSGDYVPAQKCSGSGACQAPSPSKCGEYACTPQGCKTSCTVAGDCSAGVQCIGGKCGGKRALGDTCGGNSECTSPGFCIDGVCCGSKCDGNCEACSTTITGGNSGECLPVPASKGKQGDCAAQSPGSCGTTGRCDGARKCEFHAAGTECAGQMCSGSGGFTPARKCDGAGQCLSVAINSCGAHICASGSCKNPCGNDSDCLTGNFCNGGTCTPKKDNGLSCTTGGQNQCRSGICASSFCCNSTCGGACESCKSGTCSNVCQDVSVTLNNNISGHLHTVYGAVSKRESIAIGDTELQTNGYHVAYFSFDVSSVPFGYKATKGTVSFVISGCTENAFALGSISIEPLDYGPTFETADAAITARRAGNVFARSTADVGSITIDVLDWLNEDLTNRHGNLSQYRLRFATTANNDGSSNVCNIANSPLIGPVVSLSMSVRLP